MLQTEITNNCTCTVYDELVDGPAVDENGDAIPSEYCYGCFEEAVDDLHYNVLQDWLGMHSASDDNYLLIMGSNMNWDRVSGFIIARATGKAIVDALSINGDYRLRFVVTQKPDDETFYAIRSSHDELGAKFTFEVLPDEQVEKFRDSGLNFVE
jgi:hypothetical protein